MHHQQAHSLRLISPSFNKVPEPYHGAIESGVHSGRDNTNTCRSVGLERM